MLNTVIKKLLIFQTIMIKMYDIMLLVTEILQFILKGVYYICEDVNQ